ncbi:sodium-coupled monocarboxylate transporter 1-like isoform X2 [Dermacentor andersoni]|uniref:sodium-coupled monocarboxylate transporter 1-like isoform X2 n=1 Tax=Dermacentor andersoni TaxID=34620 RepID=UPI0021552E3A|nr:sodium-coupled monocarboxylate transporter 1-like isoform X2 [Dermacentor andersoni]
MAATVHVAEYVVFGVLMLSNLLVGLYFSFGQRARDGGTSEAFLGGRSLGALPLSLSVLASLVTAVGVVGLTAHFYRYGLHLLWASVTVFCLVPFIARVVVPVIYRLRVTSVFEYLRLRFGNKVGVTACACYFVLNQMQGAISIFAAGVAVSMSFHMPLVWSCVAIGFAGTLYTAMGGLRAVVWADAVQGVLILVCPLTILVKILYDSVYDASANASAARRPFSDIDIKPYIFRASLDFTTDENVWACSVGLLSGHIYRMGMDQMVVQRYAAARSLPEAQRTVMAGSVLLVVSTTFLAVVAMALVYWYRDCDPILSGTIHKIEQLIPLYVHTRLSGIPGFSGLFLTGVVSATLSTVTSAVNSLAATAYVDMMAPYMRIEERWVNVITKGLAFASGLLMTLLALAIPYIGSAVRVFMVMHSSASGPFIGIYLLALAFPWANTKGVMVSASLTTAFQLWVLTGKLFNGVKPAAMPMTLDHCPGNATVLAATFASKMAAAAAANKRDIFPLYLLSSYWSGLIAAVMTIAIGLTVSAATGGNKNTAKHIPLTSEVFLQLWAKVKLLKEPEEEKAQKEPLKLINVSELGATPFA